MFGVIFHDLSESVDTLQRAIVVVLARSDADGMALLQTSPRLKHKGCPFQRKLRGREEVNEMFSEFSSGIPALANALFPREADTYHDFRPACSVGVMRDVSEYTEATMSYCRHDAFAKRST